MKQTIFEQQDINRYREIKESITHLSSSIDGILKRLSAIEKTSTELQTTSQQLVDAIELIAQELDMTEEASEA